MADLNDFKIIDQHSKKYSEYLITQNTISEIDKPRFGFYLLALECITGEKEIDTLQNMINDTEFNSVVNDILNDDLGIDAVYIDEDNNSINLFNFKYRKHFKENKKQNLNDTVISTKFVNSIENNSSRGLSEKTASFIKDILEKLHSSEVWSLNLYMVSNDAEGISKDDFSSQTISSLEKAYGLKVFSYSLDDFSNFIAQRPEGITGTLILDRDAVLSYEETSISSSKSYLFILPVSELLRITSNDEKFRNDYNCKEESIKKFELDFLVLFDNVRGYLGNTKYNNNIFKSLDEEPTKFFMFNNGVTMTASDISATQSNGRKKWIIELSDFQVVNGGQTLKTLYKYKNKIAESCNKEGIDFEESKKFENLFEANILIRVFQTGKESELTNKIAEYTNSQNAISSVDLKSLDSLQMKIENFLESVDINYVRKVGDIGDNKKDYKLRITMEKFGQLLYSILGYPDRASNQKKKIFDAYYDETFKNEAFKLEDSAKIINNYKKIIEYYQKPEIKDQNIEYFDQKAFYCLFLQEKGFNLEESVELIENTLQNFRADEDISPARKLIQKGFKDELSIIIQEKNTEEESR